MARRNRRPLGTKPFADLTRRAQQFAGQRVAQPLLTLKECARLAGVRYSTEQSLQNQASELERETHAAQEELAKREYKPALGALAIQQITHLAVHGHPDAVKLAASKLLAELTGHGVVSRSEHTVEVRHDVRDMEALRQELIRDAQALGIAPPTALLAAPDSAVVEAHFEEVAPPKKRRAHKTPAQMAYDARRKAKPAPVDLPAVLEAELVAALNGGQTDA